MTTPKEPEGAEPMARELVDALTRPSILAATAFSEVVRQCRRLLKLGEGESLVDAVAALEKERDAARDDNARLRAELADAEQQLGVLRPGGRYAWKTKAEAAEAQRDAAREALRESQAVMFSVLSAGFGGGGAAKSDLWIKFRMAMDGAALLLSSPSSSAAKPETR